MTDRCRGLYVITDTARWSRDALVRAVAAAIAGGARIVQYRDKSTDVQRRLDEAAALRTLTRAHDVLFLINDDIDLACRVAADGVHLGRDDGSIDVARTKMGQNAIIGASCYDSIIMAREAEQAGADYVAFGSFFPSKTKPDAVSAPIELLTQAREALSVPICAIGGITRETAPVLIAAGADMLAVISAVFCAPDIEVAAREFSSLWPESDPS